MPSFHRPLTDPEFDTLAGFIGRVDGGDIPDLETLDGFLTALAICPEFVPPSEFLEVIFTGADGDRDLVFEDTHELTTCFDLLMRHWNTIGRTLGRDELYWPILLEDEEGVARGNAWAHGFLLGMEMRRPAWNPMVNDEERGGPFIPIFALACEHHPEPEMRPYPEPMTAEQRETLHAGLVAGILQLYRAFADDRLLAASLEPDLLPIRPKIGRNAPCPCGSGRKYKKCCGAAPVH